MQVVELKKALWLKLDMAGGNSGNVCLYLPHKRKTFPGMCQEYCSLWQLDLSSERRELGKAGEK